MSLALRRMDISDSKPYKLGSLNFKKKFQPIFDYNNYLCLYVYRYKKKYTPLFSVYDSV